MNAPHLMRCRGIVKGTARGPALVSREPISFLGDLDIRSGRVVGRLPSIHGETISGKVLVFPFSMGSAGAWRFIYQLSRHGTAPSALLCREIPDPSVVQGAILAGIPVVCAPNADIVETVTTGAWLEVDGTAGTVRVADQPFRGGP